MWPAGRGASLVVALITGVMLITLLAGGIAVAQTGCAVIRTAQIGGASQTIARGPGGTLYVGDGVGLIAAQQASDGRVVPYSRVTFPSVVRQLVVGERTGYLLTERNPTIFVLDLTDPLAPVRVDAGPAVEDAQRLRLFDDRLYVATGDSIQIFDLADALAPRWISAVAGPEYSALTDIAVSGNIAYVAGNAPSSGDAPFNLTVDLLFFDLTDPLAPTLLSTQTLPMESGLFAEADDPQHLHVQGNWLYGIGHWSFRSHDHLGLFRGDIRDPTATWPTYGNAFAVLPDDEPPGDSPVSQQATALGLGDGYAVALSDWPLAGGVATVIDLTPADPALPRQASVVLGEGAADLVLSGFEGFVAQSGGGVARLDLSRPFTPAVEAALTLLGRVESVDMVDVGAGTGGDGQAVIFNATNDTLTRLETGRDPVVTGRLVLPGARGVMVQGALGFANVRTAADGLQMVLVDLTARPDPAVLSVTDFGPFDAVAVWGHYAYIAAAESDGADAEEVLYVLDLANPAQPVVVTQLAWTGVSRHLTVAGERLYRVSGDGDFEIYGLADAGEPARQGTLALGDLSADAGHFVVNGEAAYVVISGGRVEVLDVSGPSAPASVGFLETSWPVVDMALSGDGELYMAESAYIPLSRLAIYDVSDALAPQLRTRRQLAGQGLGVAFGRTIMVADGSAGLGFYALEENPLFLPQIQLP